MAVVGGVVRVADVVVDDGGPDGVGAAGDGCVEDLFWFEAALPAWSAGGAAGDDLVASAVAQGVEEEGDGGLSGGECGGGLSHVDRWCHRLGLLLPAG